MASSNSGDEEKTNNTKVHGSTSSNSTEKKKDKTKDKENKDKDKDKDKESNKDKKKKSRHRSSSLKSKSEIRKRKSGSKETDSLESVESGSSLSHIGTSSSSLKAQTSNPTLSVSSSPFSCSPIADSDPMSEEKDIPAINVSFTTNPGPITSTNSTMTTTATSNDARVVPQIETSTSSIDEQPSASGSSSSIINPELLEDDARRRSPKDEKKRRSKDRSSTKLKVIGTNTDKRIEIFEKGFLQELESGAFSDITLRVSSQTYAPRDYHVHRLIIAKNSYYLRDILTLDPSKKLIDLKLQDEAVTVFPLILRYLYSGNANCNLENGVAILSLAVFLRISELQKLVFNFLFQKVSRDSAWDLLLKIIDVPDSMKMTPVSPSNSATSLSSPTSTTSSETSLAPIKPSRSSRSLAEKDENMFVQLKDKFLDIVAKNFSQMAVNVDITKLPPEVLVELLSKNNLAVKNELVVYNTVAKFLKAAPENIAELYKPQLFETIRFPLMNTDELKYVEREKLVPSNLLSDALLQKLKKVEGQSNISSKWQPRQTQAISLEYRYDFDEGGVLYYIGTKRYQEPWANPSLRGRIRVSSSTTSIEKGKVTDICEREPTECWTNNHPSSWFSINLGSQCALVPNYYTLRHGGNSKNDCLRNWTLQGSYDGKTWEIISRHVNDTSLNAPFATASWPVTCHRSYRLFKVVQTGRNSSHSNFLSLSGFEIYGDLYESKYILQNGYASP